MLKQLPTFYRLWKSKNPRQETLRIVVLDEKNREEVQKLVSLVYTLAEVRVHTILELTPPAHLLPLTRASTWMFW